MLQPADILDFWLGSLDARGWSPPEVAQRWFIATPEFDAAIRDRFEGTWQAIRSGRRDGWLESPRDLLAYVIVLDQLGRNMFRGTPAMFAGDDLARAATLKATGAGWDQDLATAERCFLYMPLMHSERLEDQEHCVALFDALRLTADPSLAPTLSRNLEFAVRHRDIVQRWGRFPHRNATLGRPSTEEERAFLQTPGSSF